MPAQLVTQISARDVPDRTRISFSLSVVRLGDGSILSVPVHVLAGTGARPCIAVVAGVHGDEAEGIAALLELSRSLDPAEITGRLILVPIANPPAFAAHQRRSPIDGVDLNRVFPGDPNGTASERLAHRLFELVKDNAEFLFTLHSWYATGNALPHAEISAKAISTRSASFKAAVASGFEYIRLADWNPGLFPCTINSVGIPSMEAEIGGMGVSTATYRDAYRTHVMALMAHFGMIASKAPGPSRPKQAYTTQHVVAGVGGILRSDAALGSHFKCGELMGVIADADGLTIEELRCPADSILMARRTFLSVSPGEIIFRLLQPASVPEL